MNEVLSLLVVVALLLGNAFFVAAEFALVSARADQLEPRAQAGSVRAQKALAAMRNVSQMMAGAQLGITLCSLGLGAVGEPAVAHPIEGPLAAVGAPEGLLHPVSLVIALALITVLHMVLGEMVPKNITIAGPARAALVLGPPLAVLVRLVKPFIWFFNVTANGFVRLFGVQPTDEVSASFDEGEIRSMIAQSRQEGLLGSEVSELAAGALT
ncbi:MAG: Hemolysin, contains domain, partial [Modestobacter sp.]|nr:Hemolysin, contains domain [Modestobacter sp.]